MNMKSTLSTLSALAVICQASAATFVTSAPATGSATGDYTTLWEASGATSIAALGAYNSGSTGTVGNPLTVSLFNFSGSLIASVVVSGSGDGAIGSFVYKNLDTPVVLSGGSYYTLSVSGFTGAAPYNNITLGSFAGAFIGGGGYVGGPVFGNGGGGGFTEGNPSSFAAGSFSTTAVSAVPEPETYAMLAGLGLVGFGLYRRCRN